MSVNIWGVRMQDDVSAVSAKMATSLETLAKDVDILGKAFKKSNTGNLSVGLKEAEKLWKASAGNVKLFSASLKDAGASALDSRLLIGKFNAELTNTRKHALGLSGGFWSRVFSPNSIWRMSHALNVLTKGFGIAQAAVGGFMGVAQAGLGYAKQGIGSVVENATKRQNTLATLQYLYQKPGTDEKQAMGMAKEDFAWAQQMAKDTPLDTEQVINAMTQFSVAKFDRRQSKILATVAADQQSKNLSRPEMMQNVINAFSRMQGRGTATGEDLESLRIAGFRAGDIMNELRQIPEIQGMFKGIKKDASDEEVAVAVKKVLGTGKIGTMTMTQAALNSLERDKPDIGYMGKKLGAESLQGTISNFQNAWNDLLQSDDLVEWKGIKALMGLMTRVSDVLSGSSESGKRLLKIVEQVTNNLLEGMNKITSEDIEGFLTGAAKVALQLSEWVKQAWTWVDKLLHAEPGTFVDAMADVLMDIGAMIGAGIWKGVKMGASALADDRYQKRHGIAHSEIKYQAQQQGRSEEAVLAEFERNNELRKSRGVKVADRYWSSDQAHETYVTALAQRASDGTQQPGYGVLKQDTTDVLQSLNANIAALTGAIGGVPAMAEGGMVARPTLALIGERGPEMVVPLSRAASVLGGGRGGGASASITIHAGPGSAGEQWEAIRPLITREVTAMFTRAAAEG